MSRDGRVRHYASDGSLRGDNATPDTPGVMSLLQALDGRVWVGTFGAGVIVIDPATGTAQRIGGPTDALSGARATAITQGPDGTMWVGTEARGLTALCSDGSIIATWKHDDADRTSLASNTIFALCVDASGRVWVGTDSGGLDRIIGSPTSPGSVHFVNMTTRNGLSSDTIYGIEADDLGARSGEGFVARRSPVIATPGSDRGHGDHRLGATESGRTRDGGFGTGGRSSRRG